MAIPATYPLRKKENISRVTYVEVGYVLSVQGLVDGQLSRDGVDDEDACGGLVCTWPSHAVPQGAPLVVVRSNLWRASARSMTSKHTTALQMIPGTPYRDRGTCLCTCVCLLVCLLTANVRW